VVNCELTGLFVTIVQETTAGAPASGVLTITEIDVRGAQQILPPVSPSPPPPSPSPPSPAPLRPFYQAAVIAATGTGAYYTQGDLQISNIFDGSFSTVALIFGAPAWISLELAAPTRVSSVVVYNQAGTHANLLGSFSVYVSNTPASGQAGIDQTFTKCNGVYQTTATVGPFTIQCPSPIPASYVTVIQEAPFSGVLAIAEIVVGAYLYG